MADGWFMLTLIGLLAGLLSGLFGIGGGLIIVPLLVFAARLDIHQAVGTSLAVIVPTAAVGALRHSWAGHVVWKYVIVVAIFATIGGFFGAQMTTWISSRLLKKLFAVFMAVVAVRMILSR